MSSVLFLSDNAHLRCRVEATLPAVGHTVITVGVGGYQPSDQKFDCAVVDSGATSPTLVATLNWVGIPCLIGIYTAEEEHLVQLKAGALLCIPAAADVAKNLQDGPKSVSTAIELLEFAKPTGNWERDRWKVGLMELTIGFKNPIE